MKRETKYRFIRGVSRNEENGSEKRGSSTPWNYILQINQSGVIKITWNPNKVSRVVILGKQ